MARAHFGQKCLMRRLSQWACVAHSRLEHRRRQEAVERHLFMPVFEALAQNRKMARLLRLRSMNCNRVCIRAWAGKARRFAEVVEWSDFVVGRRKLGHCRDAFSAWSITTVESKEEKLVLIKRIVLTVMTKVLSPIKLLRRRTIRERKEFFAIYQESSLGSLS